MEQPKGDIRNHPVVVNLNSQLSRANLEFAILQAQLVELSKAYELLEKEVENVKKPKKNGVKPNDDLPKRVSQSVPEKEESKPTQSE